MKMIKEAGLNLINNSIVWLIKAIATIGLWIISVKKRLRRKMSQERKDNFIATLVAAIVVFCLVLITVACMAIPIMLSIDIKYIRIIDINDDLKDRITLSEKDIEEIKAAPKWYGDK